MPPGSPQGGWQDIARWRVVRAEAVVKVLVCRVCEIIFERRVVAMISEQGYDTLRYFQRCGGYIHEHDISPEFPNERVRSLCGDGFLVAQRVKEIEWEYKISPMGLDALAEFAEARYQDAQDKAHQRLKDEREDKWKRKDARRSWIHLVINILVAIAFFVLGVLIDGASPMKQWILGIFGQ